jgi:hypothetical protein
MMFAVKIHQEKEERTEEFEKTIDNISSYICDKLRTQDVKVLSDTHCIEIVSGQTTPVSEDEVIAELVIRKTIVINKKDIGDRAELDRYISSIKHFCDQAREIEENQYLPPHMR